MVRPERTFECYSRGHELIRAIREMRERNDRLPRDTWERTRQTNRTIEQRINTILAEFGLTVEEWHYWCRQAGGAP